MNKPCIEAKEDKGMTRDGFIKLMKKQLNGEGERKYSDVYIMKQADDMHDLT